MTYEDLFALLVSLGFRSVPSTQPGPQGFIHDDTGSILLYRGAAGETIRPADLLSTEVHLHARGIIDEPLESLLAAAAMPK